MAEWLVRDLAIEEALQDEIKDTLEHNNNDYFSVSNRKSSKIITAYV